MKENAETRHNMIQDHKKYIWFLDTTLSEKKSVDTCSL